MLEHNKRNQKKLRRKENKKKKLKALIEISSLNDKDRKKLTTQNAASNNFRGSALGQKEQKTSEEPNTKRMRRELLFPLNGTAYSSENEVFIKNEKRFTDEQSAEFKKLMKMRKRMRHERPFLELNEIGEAASVGLLESQRVPLPLDDFQHFIISSVLAHMATKGPCRWINYKKHQKLERRIFMVLEGAGLKEYLENEKDLVTLSQFEKKLEVITPTQYGGDLISELALVSLTSGQIQKLANEYGSLKKAFSSGDVFNTIKTIFPITSKCTTTLDKEPVNTQVEKVESKMLEKPKDKFSRKQLLLSPWDMIEENYPIPISGELGRRFSDFVFTRDDYSEVTDNSPMWALDCEMCLTTVGSELTRICIVDEDCNIVYETLVKPSNPIRNYLTKFSGITSSMLRHVKTRLEDVQADVRAICPPDVILIGQSLNMDLIAMKMMHPYVIDTSVIFNMSGIRQRKTKLRVLVEQFLSLRIQVEDVQGHSPIEDALAAMKLVQAKLSHSLSWGNALLTGPRSEEESVSARLLLESREAAGMARISTADSKRLTWPQLSKQRQEGRGMMGINPKSSSLILPSEECHVENISATSLFSHLVRHNKNALFVAKKNNLDKWAHYCGNVDSNRFCMKEVETNRAAIRYIREHTPADGTGIAYLTLTSQQPALAILKADKLVNKLMKNTTGNTLYSVLLTGSSENPGNGLMVLHLAREKIPLISRI